VAVLKVRVSEDLAAAFDASAAAVGGRSALLRRLVQDQVRGSKSGVLKATPGPRSAARLMVRLAPVDAAHVEASAAAMGLRRAGWVAALVRRHALGRPTFDRTQEVALLAIQGELRRIGVNVNQIAHAMNTAIMEGRVLALELQSIEDLRRELRGHILAMREAFAGNLAYWETDL
jgi:hypothetical protein